MTEVPILTLHELADGVFVWLQPGGESGVSNAGVVVDDDGITVIDTLMVRSQWEPFAGAVARARPAGAPDPAHPRAHRPRRRHARPSRTRWCYGSPQTSELLDGEMPLDAYKAFMPAFDEEFDELAELGTRPVTHLVTDGAFLTPRIEVHARRRATPTATCMVLVADADVLFAGDLCFFGVTPLAFQGDPATVGRRCSTSFAELARRSCPATARSAATTRSASCRQYLRHCVAGDDPARPVGHVARARPARRDQHRARRSCSPPAATRCRRRCSTRSASADPSGVLSRAVARSHATVWSTSSARRRDRACPNGFVLVRERVAGVGDVLEARRPCPCSCSSFSSVAHGVGREEVVVLGEVAEHRRGQVRPVGRGVAERRAVERRGGRRPCRPAARRSPT